MGANSSDALAAFLKEYLSRCTVVGDRIVTPDKYDRTAGGVKLPGPVPGTVQEHGRPDWKRGQ